MSTRYKCDPDRSPRPTSTSTSILMPLHYVIFAFVLSIFQRVAFSCDDWCHHAVGKIWKWFSPWRRLLSPLCSAYFWRLLFTLRSMSSVISVRPWCRKERRRIRLHYMRLYKDGAFGFLDKRTWPYCRPLVALGHCWAYCHCYTRLKDVRCLYHSQHQPTIHVVALE